MNETIRVAHIMGEIAKGGVESVVFNYYKFIDRTKVQFDFIIHDGSPYEIPDEILALGCKVYKTPPYARLPAYIRALKEIFERGGYRIVHSHMNALSAFALFAAKRAKVPVRIAHSHATAGKGRGEFIRNMLKYALRPFSRIYPTHLFACSEHAGKWLFGGKAFKQGRVTVIHNAVDPAKFAYDEEIRSRARNGLGLNGKFVVGHVGRFMPVKNHCFLIDVFYEIRKKDKDGVLLLIGDGELRRKIEEKADKLNLREDVLFLGGRDDVNELYPAMDVLVLPSLYEGLPVVLVEAQMAGLPAVVSDRVPGEAKFSDKVEFMGLRESAEAWAEKILAKRAVSRVGAGGLPEGAKFDIREQARKLEDLYGNFT
ncbi:MAG: glycosyltransferase family 1 protein [Oscillospiraceae bacterium]|jgi:glycosyltransferase EpsF|nr:glycosyltransferase family 1 protein [Oscillospiraceae bacterium]